MVGILFTLRIQAPPGSNGVFRVPIPSEKNRNEGVIHVLGHTWIFDRSSLIRRDLSFDNILAVNQYTDEVVNANEVYERDTINNSAYGGCLMSYPDTGVLTRVQQNGIFTRPACGFLSPPPFLQLFAQSATEFRRILAQVSRKR